MKKLFIVLAATVICSACLFTSCNKPITDLPSKLQGKWIVADLNGEPCQPYNYPVEPQNK